MATKNVPDGLVSAIKSSAVYLDSGSECLTWSQVERIGVAVAAWLRAEGKRREEKKERTEVALEFVECDTCRAKPGSPTLCRGCVVNRAVIESLGGRSKSRYE